MITALKALSLPSSRLSDEEARAADEMEAAFDAHVKKFMALRGVDFETRETKPNVIAEVVRRLRLAGWTVEWQPMMEQHRLNRAAAVHVGWKLSISPSEDAHREHARVTSIAPREETLCANPTHTADCCKPA